MPDRIALLHIMCHLLALFAKVVLELPEAPPLRWGEEFTVHGSTTITIYDSHVQKRVRDFESADNMNKDVQTLVEASGISCFFDKATNCFLAKPQSQGVAPRSVNFAPKLSPGPCSAPRALKLCQEV